MVDTDSSIPSRAYCSLCRLSGWWLAYFSTSIIASRLGPAKPRAIAWNGAGGCVIVSHDRQLNFSRTCSVTNHCRGTTSSWRSCRVASLNFHSPLGYEGLNEVGTDDVLE